MAAKKNDSEPIFLLMQLTGDRSGDRWRMSIRHMRNDQPQLVYEMPLEDFEVRAYLWNGEDMRKNPEKKTAPVFCWKVGFDSRFLELHHLRDMTALAEKIERKMARLDERYGRPATFSEYVIRVGTALGVAGYVRQGVQDTSQWVVLDAMGARYFIDSTQREYVNRLCPEVAA